MEMSLVASLLSHSHSRSDSQPHSKSPLLPNHKPTLSKSSQQSLPSITLSSNPSSTSSFLHLHTPTHPHSQSLPLPTRACIKHRDYYMPAINDRVYCRQRNVEAGGDFATSLHPRRSRFQTQTQKRISSNFVLSVFSIPLANVPFL